MPSVLGRDENGDDILIKVNASGELIVVPSTDTAALDGHAYMGGVQLGGVTSQFGIAQFYNPVGSGRRVLLDHYVVGSNSNGHIAGLIEQTDRGGTAGNITPVNPVSGAAVAIIQAISDATAPSVTHMILRATANRYMPMKLSSPIILSEGYGFTCYTGTVTTTIALMCQWRELSL